VLSELKAHIVKYINLFNYAGENEMASGHGETTSNGSSCFDTKEDDQTEEEFNYVDAAEEVSVFASFTNWKPRRMIPFL
jgi:hypothetical protein